VTVPSKERPMLSK